MKLLDSQTVSFGAVLDSMNCLPADERKSGE